MFLNVSRCGQIGQSASTVAIKSSSSRKGSAGCGGGTCMPPQSAKGCSTDFFEEFIEQRIPIEQMKVLSDLGQVQSDSIRS